jgi:large subunit ribosomal protein L24
MKIKKGDLVKILSGKDKGKQGKIIKMLPKVNKAVVEGINLHKKHAKAKQSGQKGEVVLLPAPLILAKMQLICPQCGKITRVCYEISGTNSNKIRICKKCRQAV